ncbi:hypothetical protein J3E69DRAFT_146201 [Trichoderma sp. SZMC 28015]
MGGPELANSCCSLAAGSACSLLELSAKNIHWISSAVTSPLHGSCGFLQGAPFTFTSSLSHLQCFLGLAWHETFPRHCQQPHFFFFFFLLLASPFSYAFCAAICFIHLPVLSGCFISLLTLDLAITWLDRVA